MFGAGLPYEDRRVLLMREVPWASKAFSRQAGFETPTKYFQRRAVSTFVVEVRARWFWR